MCQVSFALAPDGPLPSEEKAALSLETSERIDPPMTILFVRGGPGTGGFLEGGSDDQLSSIYDESTANGNHGWAELATVLETLGFTLEEMREEPVVNGVPTPIPFDQMDLSSYAIIVLASNNAAYTTAQVDAIENFVRSGGGVLFISDANFGQDWPDAPTSDQAFLDRFGLVMNQDQGTYSISDDEYRNTPHPILDGIAAFDGEGVSPVTVDNVPSDVSVEILAGAEGNVRRNDTNSGQGSSTSATEDDAALLYGSAGNGRFVVHFDRNTFFNENGAGTDITRFDNRAFAENLFRWLDGQTPLPVDVSGFTGIYDGDRVVLSWQSVDEVDVAGYSIDRRFRESGFQEIGFTAARARGRAVEAYRFSDAALQPTDLAVEYRLRSVDVDGTEQIHGVTTVQRNQTETSIRSRSSSPLPSIAEVEVFLAQAGKVHLAVYDILGRRLLSLREGRMASGSHLIRFQTDSFPSGRYFVRMQFRNRVFTESVSVVR